MSRALARASLVAVVVLGTAVLVSACQRREPFGDGPQGWPAGNAASVARDFITAGVVDHNGYQACGYLTAREQRAAARRVGGGECRQAFDLARLRLGGKEVQTVHAVDGLTASSSVHGDRERVRLTHGGASVDFRLVKANFAEREQFQAPDTHWRIAGGELALIPPQGR